MFLQGRRGAGLTASLAPPSSLSISSQNPPPALEPILPTDARRQRKHPDLRLARRARTIANLARVISERKVKLGIRQTLCAQAKRLEQLAEARLESFKPTRRRGSQ